MFWGRSRTRADEEIVRLKLQVASLMTQVATLVETVELLATHGPAPTGHGMRTAAESRFLDKVFEWMQSGEDQGTFGLEHHAIEFTSERLLEEPEVVIDLTDDMRIDR